MPAINAKTVASDTRIMPEMTYPVFKTVYSSLYYLVRSNI
jgi:hypothetical protein